MANIIAKHETKNSTQNAQILQAVAHMMDAQPPTQMKETLHEVLLQWLKEADNIDTQQKDRFLCFYTEIRCFFVSLETIKNGI
jgi:hypothetical protein